jgi:CRP/FNR family cyclic AMP-dependent transcriptional regulator
MVAQISAAELQSIPFFKDLDLSLLESLLERHRLADLSAAETLIMQSDWGENLMVLLSGIAKVRLFSADGDEVVLSLLGAGDLIGELSLLDGDSRSADVVTLTPVRLLKLQGGPFLRLLQQQPLLALRLARLEAGRLRDINRRFAIQKSDATTRVLDALAYLAVKGSLERDPLHPIPVLAQGEIAILAGLARETLSRTLSKLRSRAIVIEAGEGWRLATLQPLQRRGLLP